MNVTWEHGLNLTEDSFDPDSGSIHLGDIDVLAERERVRETLGYLPQEFGVYPKMSAEELFTHFAVLKGIAGRRERREVVEALLRQVSLHDARRKKLGGYSGGMRQRFGVAAALPLILDIARRALNNPPRWLADAVKVHLAGSLTPGIHPTANSEALMHELFTISSANRTPHSTEAGVS